MLATRRYSPPVSNANTEILRQVVEAWNARDIERFVALIHPDAELRTMRAQLEGKAYRGRDGARQAAADIDEDWGELRMELEEVQVTEDRAFARIRLTGRGRTSGVDMDVVTGWIFGFREGLVAFARAYSDPEQAREQLGVAT